MMITVREPRFNVGLLGRYPSTSCLLAQALDAALKAWQQGICSRFSNIYMLKWLQYVGVSEIREIAMVI